MSTSGPDSGAHSAHSADSAHTAHSADSADSAQDGADRPTLSRQEVAHLAHLARLEVTDEELDRYADQLGVILASVATVSEVAADDIEPTSHAVPLVNVFRDDVQQPGLTREQALAMAPAAEQGRFRVPQILGEEQ